MARTIDDAVRRAVAYDDEALKAIDAAEVDLASAELDGRWLPRAESHLFT